MCLLTGMFIWRGMKCLGLVCVLWGVAWGLRRVCVCVCLYMRVCTWACVCSYILSPSFPTTPWGNTPARDRGSHIPQTSSSALKHHQGLTDCGSHPGRIWAAVLGHPRAQPTSSQPCSVMKGTKATKTSNLQYRCAYSCLLICVCVCVCVSKHCRFLFVCSI